jgi:hypothetical protein
LAEPPISSVTTGVDDLPSGLENAERWYRQPRRLSDGYLPIVDAKRDKMELLRVGLSCQWAAPADAG